MPAPAPAPSLPAAALEPADSLEALGDRIARLSAHITAATYRLLVLIREFDEAEGWHMAGFTSCARWLSWRTGVGPRAAREQVRVARALEELPALSRALERGELSYSVARAVTRVATPENEAELVETANHSTAAQMERLVSAWRATDRAEAAGAAEAEAERHRSRELTLAVDGTDGSWVLRGRLDPEAGAALVRALEAAEDELYGENGEPEEEDAHRPRAARRADALGRVAEAALGEGLGAASRAGDRYQVVVHVPAGALAGEAGAGSAEPPRLEGGPGLFPETARRLSCDAGVLGLVEDGAGNVLDVGRKRRTVPAATRRALEARDGGRCGFPGCAVPVCEAHHVTPWAEGGATSLGNLLLLCRRHHRRVHEGGWEVRRDEDRGGGFSFHRPDGKRLPEVPPVPALPGDPVEALTGAQRGLGIDAWTATPDWEGEQMDAGWALLALRGPGAGPGGVNGGSTDPEGGGSAEPPAGHEEAPPGDGTP